MSYWIGRTPRRRPRRWPSSWEAEQWRLSPQSAGSCRDHTFDGVMKPTAKRPVVAMTSRHFAPRRVETRLSIHHKCVRPCFDESRYCIRTQNKAD